MTTPNSYVEADPIRISAIFYDANDAAADPAKVFCDYQIGTNAKLTLEYGKVGDEALVKDSTGHYHVDVSTVGKYGSLRYRWYSTGDGATANQTFCTITQQDPA